MTSKEATKLIEEIESIDLNTEKGQNSFNSIIQSRVITGGGFKITINPHPDLFYVRARILKNKDDYYYTIDDHSYNKKYPQCIKQGRANFKEQPIFYAGRTRITALAEVNIIQNKVEEQEVAYAVSRWVINKPLDLVAILNPDTVSQINCMELNNFLEFIQETYQSLIGTPNEGMIKFYKYLSEKFTERITEGEENKYIVTSTFANQIFRKLPNVAGILYQSVKWPETYNLALKPNFIDDEYLMPSHVFKETFLRTNIDELKDLSMEQAKSLNYKSNIVEW